MKTEETQNNPDDRSARKKPRLISIRAKIMGAFIVVFLIPVMTMLFLLSRRIPDSFDELARVRVFGALEGIRGDFDSLRTDIEMRLESIGSDRQIVDDIWNLSRKGIFIKRISTIRDTTGLDMLQVISDKKILLADGADTARFNIDMDDDPNLEDVLRSGQSSIVIRKEFINDEEKLAIVVYQPVWYQGVPVAVLLGARYIGKEFVRRLRELTTGTVVLFIDDKPVICSEDVTPSECLPVSAEFLSGLLSDPDKITQIGSGRNDFLAGGLPIMDPASGKNVGYFVFGISREGVKNIIGRTRKDMLYMAMAGLGISIVLAFIISISITSPISRLVRFSRRIGRGDFDGATIDIRSRDEIGLLADTMNRMVKDLDDYSTKLAYTERVAAWSEIARRMAHEIKNPLSPIQLSMENLKASFNDDKATFNKFFPACADTVLEEVDKLRKLANEFSEFARLPKPVFEKVDIGEMLRNLVSFHSSSNSNIHFTIELDDAPLTVNADRDQVNRVFTNLIKNAIEAMPDGGELKVSVYSREGEIFAVIKDSGAGIPAEQLEKIFTPYYTSKTGGTGLGLSIVKRIMRDHDASIEVISEPGEGTMFTLVFREHDSLEVRGGS